MRTLCAAFLLTTIFVAPAAAQKRSAPAKAPTFAEAVEMAKKAYDAQEHGTAVAALQAAVRAVQQVQRVAILEALPKPSGYEIEDDAPVDEVANPFAASMAAFGLAVQRHYRNGDQRVDVEVTANSPVVSMVSMMLANPAVVKSDGGELVEYGTHKAMLKKNGETSLELTIVMHDKHIIKATAEGLTAEALFAIVDQAMVDRLEKPLGK